MILLQRVGQDDKTTAVQSYWQVIVMRVSLGSIDVIDSIDSNIL